MSLTYSEIFEYIASENLDLSLYRLLLAKPEERWHVTLGDAQDTIAIKVTSGDPLKGLNEALARFKRIVD